MAEQAPAWLYEGVEGAGRLADGQLPPGVTTLPELKMPEAKLKEPSAAAPASAHHAQGPRIAVPVAAPPVLKPSLIPYDVLQAYERELLQAERDRKVRRYDDPSVPGVPLRDYEEEEPNFITTGPADQSLAVSALQQVSLFSSLPTASLMAMAAAATEQQVPEGEYLFMESDPAESFYVVIDGTIEILRQKDEREVALRHIGRGEAIGLFGLFSAKLRAASARAIGDVVVIEVPSAALQQILETDDALHNRLLSFYRERILEGFVGSSRLFADVDSIARARTIGRFVQKNLSGGETLLMPGEVANLLAVVTHGTLLLEERTRLGQAPKQFEVTDGQFLAVVSALSGVPSRMRVYADGPVSLVMLGQKELADLMRDYPALRHMPQRLPQLARALDRDVFCGLTGVPGL